MDHDPIEEEVGGYADKSTCWEGIELEHQEHVDDNYGDGDPSQWTY